jgi:hypothetical protein
MRDIRLLAVVANVFTFVLMAGRRFIGSRFLWICSRSYAWGGVCSFESEGWEVIEEGIPNKRLHSAPSKKCCM